MTADTFLMMPLAPVVAKVASVATRGRDPFGHEAEERLDARFWMYVLVALLVTALALWMASECGDLVNYALAFFFPLNYIMIRLLAPCRG
jgi:hypothetical protein